MAIVKVKKYCQPKRELGACPTLLSYLSDHMLVLWCGSIELVFLRARFSRNNELLECFFLLNLWLKPASFCLL